MGKEMINLQLTIEELDAIIIALQLQSFMDGFRFKHHNLVARLLAQEEYFKENE